MRDNLDDTEPEKLTAVRLCVSPAAPVVKVPDAFFLLTVLTVAMR